MNCYLIDIDGTLSDHSHRMPYINSGGKKDFDSYYRAMSDDPPLKHTCEMVEALADYARKKTVYERETPYSLFVCTGRHRMYWDLTEEWLATYVPRLYGQMVDLCMRPDGDYRPDFIVKQEMLQSIRLRGYNPTIAIEDRPRVVDMWREEGLTCLQCV